MPEIQKVQRVCPECGGDRYRAKNAQRDLEAAQRHHKTAKDIARENGLLRYQLAVAEAQARDSHSALSRKVSRQARVIRRLEEKLRARSVKPYEGAGLEETAPGVDYVDV